ncbi:hypothetical protein ACLOJK_029901 [Asimina triloba]
MSGQADVAKLGTSHPLHSMGEGVSQLFCSWSSDKSRTTKVIGHHRSKDRVVEEAVRDALNPPTTASLSVTNPLSPPPNVAAIASTFVVVMNTPTMQQNPPLLIPLATKVGDIIFLDVDPLEVPFRRSDTTELKLTKSAVEVKSSNMIESFDTIAKSSVLTDEGINLTNVNEATVEPKMAAEARVGHEFANEMTVELEVVIEVGSGHESICGATIVVKLEVATKEAT